MQADSQQQHVKDLGVVLGAEAAAIIVDDTAAVWPQHAANLLLARPAAVYKPKPKPPLLLYLAVCTLPQCPGVLPVGTFKCDGA